MGRSVDLSNFRNEESVKLKAQETEHDYILDKVVSHGDMGCQFGNDYRLYWK